MAKFLLFSDIHFHEFTENAKLVPYQLVDGRVLHINSRLRDCAYAMRQVAEHAEANSITNIFFAGDLVHSKRHTTKTVYNVIVNELARAHSSIVWHLLCGNHDMVSADGLDNSLVALRAPNVRIYDRNNSQEVQLGYGHNDQVVRLIPFIEDKASLKAELNYPLAGPTVVILHAGVQGAKLGSDFVLSKEYDIATDDLSDEYAACFLGHYHEHQQLKDNCWYIGATHQHNWGDAGSVRGFIEVTWDNSITIKQHVIKAPRHIIVKQGDDLSAINSDDFVKYLLTEADEIPEELKAHPNVKTSFIAAEQQEATPLLITELSSDDESCKAWVDSKVKDADAAKELLLFGLELLKE
jgi:DNA repair exonuclease SbcCD nuclease subunit